MKTFAKTWEDEVVDPNDTYYKIDQKKLVKWLKHLRALNMLYKNNLHRDDVQRGRDEGRFDAYDCLLGNINRGTIFMKRKK
jgi:hypothetical protein